MNDIKKALTVELNNYFKSLKAGTPINPGDVSVEILRILIDVCPRCAIFQTDLPLTENGITYHYGNRIHIKSNDAIIDCHYYYNKSGDFLVR